MPKISTYEVVAPASNDLVTVTDASDSNNTKNVTVGSLSATVYSGAYSEIYDASGLETTSATTTPALMTVGTTQGQTNDASLQQNNSGRVTNTGLSRTFLITYSTSVSATNNTAVEFSLAKDGVVIPHSQSDMVTASGNKGISVSNTIITTLNTGQYVEVYIAVGSGTVTCTLQHLNLVLKQV
jgi:hypothetical protein